MGGGYGAFTAEKRKQKRNKQSFTSFTLVGTHYKFRLGPVFCFWGLLFFVVVVVVFVFGFLNFILNSIFKRVYGK